MWIEDGGLTLVGLTARPEDGTPAAKMRKWAEANAKARRIIVCSICADPLACFGGMLENFTAKELWHELGRTYSTSNAQAIINLEREFEELSFNDKGDWQKHMNSFHELTGKLAWHGAVLASDQNNLNSCALCQTRSLRSQCSQIPLNAILMVWLKVCKPSPPAVAQSVVGLFIRLRVPLLLRLLAIRA